MFWNTLYNPGIPLLTSVFEFYWILLINSIFSIYLINIVQLLCYHSHLRCFIAFLSKSVNKNDYNIFLKAWKGLLLTWIMANYSSIYKNVTSLKKKRVRHWILRKKIIGYLQKYFSCNLILNSFIKIIGFKFPKWKSGWCGGRKTYWCLYEMLINLQNETNGGRHTAKRIRNKNGHYSSISGDASFPFSRRVQLHHVRHLILCQTEAAVCERLRHSSSIYFTLDEFVTFAGHFRSAKIPVTAEKAIWRERFFNTRRLCQKHRRPLGDEILIFGKPRNFTTTFFFQPFWHLSRFHIRGDRISASGF